MVPGLKHSYLPPHFTLRFRGPEMWCVDAPQSVLQAVQGQTGKVGTGPLFDCVYV